MVFLVAPNSRAQGETKVVPAAIAGGAENSPGVEFIPSFGNVGAFWEHRSAEVCGGGGLDKAEVKGWAAACGCCELQQHGSRQPRGIATGARRDGGRGLMPRRD